MKLKSLYALAATLLLASSHVIAKDDIVIGASLPLSGPLAGFGLYQKWGYETAVNDVNKAGGITINGEKRKIKLFIRDDKTNSNVTARNTETLISRKKVVAMLGSCTPALVNAGALIAERRKVPLVTGCAPLQAFKGVRDWKYAWAIFFDETDLATAPFKMMSEMDLDTNRKIAILHDNGPDGILVGGKVWPDAAKKGGFEVVHSTAFPVDSQQFTTMIAKAKSSSADIALVDAIPPQGVAIRKQMASAGFNPKLLVIEKGAEPQYFAQATGKLSDGVLVGGYWDPSFPYPGASELAARFEKETGQLFSQHIADAHAAAQVLLDAIADAGSLDREAINASIAKTDKSYVIGPVKFDDKHGSAIPIVVMQWQSGSAKIVWPKDRANSELLFPLP